MKRLKKIGLSDAYENEETMQVVFRCLLALPLLRDVTRLGLGGPKPPPPKDVAAPSNWNGNRSFCTAVLGHMLL